MIPTLITIQPPPTFSAEVSQQIVKRGKQEAWKYRLRAGTDSEWLGCPLPITSGSLGLGASRRRPLVVGDPGCGRPPGKCGSSILTKKRTASKSSSSILRILSISGPLCRGCPVLNTGIEADDGNPVLRAHAAKALRFWLSRLQAIVEQARKRSETRPGVDPKAVATVIAASLEGALMMSRLQRNNEPLHTVQSHLSRFLETEVAVA
jgi:hypothetical protein